ncbi:hypothetical protein ASPZODRAFT_16874 [Penicilliopsis zonata CBS 506.65]|uniref:Uncharacterized protein n=1 Tax=Penicilliopsis zonata CBS 506.65 TaxID=1073090 RepID=A0A1L9SGM6_9EURO|nr:hypothetical protein ASPZODRAFT_16874 [Penicilliopsis zonata CBS 506.65]OJJ46273.1 hypothetical protein ASPZODRAFT_16874 [Penicilliopsis zonata CBS 506.65]
MMQALQYYAPRFRHPGFRRHTAPPHRLTRREERQKPQPVPGDEIYYPSVVDVLKVRHMLRWKIGPGGFPVEIVDMIIDAAEYWPSVEKRMKKPVIIPQDLDRELVRSVPLCYDESTLGSPSNTPRTLPHRTIHPCRKIEFRISSHDQGFGDGSTGHDRFEHSWTWFDAETVHAAHSPERYQQEPPQPQPQHHEQQRRHFGPDDPLLLPRANKLQSNARSAGTLQHFTVTWHYLDNVAADSDEAETVEKLQGRGRATLDGRTVRELEIGDSIAVFGRARFRAWSNHVERMSVPCIIQSILRTITQSPSLADPQLRRKNIKAPVHKEALASIPIRKFASTVPRSHARLDKPTRQGHLMASPSLPEIKLRGSLPIGRVQSGNYVGPISGLPLRPIAD